MSPVLLNPSRFGGSGGGGGSYSAAVLADSPLAYYRFGDGSGTTAADSSGNGRAMTWDAAPAYVAGLLTSDPTNGAVNPSGHFASIANAAWQSVSSLTVEALVKFTTIPAGAGIVDKYGGGVSGQSLFLLYTPSGKLTWLVRTISGDVTAQWATTPTTGTVYHVAGVANGSTAKLYIDGTEVASVAAGTLSIPASAGMVIGKAAFNGVFTNGVIDEAAIYGTALSPTRIAAHAAAV